MSARGAEKGRDALQAFLAHATTGIAARCTAINTDMGDSLLPTAWNIPLRKGKRAGIKLATGTGGLWVAFSEEDYFDGARTEQRQNYGASFILAVVVGIGKTNADPDIVETVLMRLSRALHECFDAQPPLAAWKGHTLAGRVVSARPGRFTAGPDPVIEIAGTRAALLTGPILVIVQEDQGVT